VPQEARAVAPPDKPSCPVYMDEEIAAFEVSGYRGYEYASTG
jgi:hypothetical protein